MGQVIPEAASDDQPPVVGDESMPIGGVFGDQVPGACEYCGGGNCLPPCWSIQPSFSVISLSRPNNIRLGTDSLPAGPLSAGSVVVTNSGLQTQQNFTQYLNDTVEISALETHTPAIDDSPMYGFVVRRFLGRDGENRDHFIEAAFNGLDHFQSAMTADGTVIPFFGTVPTIQAIPAAPPTVLYFQGSLVSPFPIFLPLNGNQGPLVAPYFSPLGETYDKAFNRSTVMLTTFGSNYNEFELNYRFVGHNQPDQLVLNPNGRWYRQCETGYFYSYFFGLKSMIINESSTFLSQGALYQTQVDQAGVSSPGAAVHAPRNLRRQQLQHARRLADGREVGVPHLPLEFRYARQRRHVHQFRPPGQSHHDQFRRAVAPHTVQRRPGPRHRH